MGGCGLPCCSTPMCPGSHSGSGHDPEEDYRTGVANFYNNYNVDYHTTGKRGGGKSSSRAHCNSVTVDGKSPKCDDVSQKGNDCQVPCCAAGFKPCEMQLRPPSCCDPLGAWTATIMPCPPKPPKRVSVKYVPGECTRPCCKHWKLKDGPCLYDKPCKAHCFNHPPGMKPSGRT